MSLVPFLVLAFGLAAACLASRGRASLEAPLAVGSLLLVTVAALAIAPGDHLRLGSGEILLATAYGRLFVVLGSAAGLVLCLVGLATSWNANLPAALLVGLGGIGLGLSATDPLVALVVLIGTAIAASLVGVDRSSTTTDILAIVRHVRLTALAGALALVALAWAAPALPGVGGNADAFGLADLAIVITVAVRFGAIPFHRPVARLTDSEPAGAIPLLLVWGPAALAVVALGATDGSSQPLLVPGGPGPALIVVVAAATLVLGAVGAWLQDDLEHVVGYSIVQDAGFVLLGLAVGGTAAHEATRSWLLILLAGKTAFATWAIVIQSRFRTARLPELDGWARRSPLLGVALVGIVVATLGLPGLLAWNVRTSLVQGATGGPLQYVLLAAGLASLAYYGRLAVVGLGRPSLQVTSAPSDRPVPAGRSGSAIDAVRGGWQLNRAPIGAGLVLILVVVSLVVSGGGLGGPAAARAAGPEPSPALVGP